MFQSQPCLSATQLVHSDLMVSDACQLTYADLDVGDIERLRSQKDKHTENIEGMVEELKILLKKQGQLEDEAAKFHRKKVSSI